ncbi:MAG: helix-turn-helix domain-containing protein [Prosthecobacter sp.]
MMNSEPPSQTFYHRLADGHELLQALDQIPAAMFMIKDCDSRYVFMSRALKDAIHLPPDFDIVGKSDFDLFPRIIAENYRQNDLLVFQRNRPLIKEIHATSFFDHPSEWAWSSKYPLHDKRGKVIGLITINEKYSESAGHDQELGRLLPAIDHVHACYMRRITIGDLARRCSFSESHFMRIFKQRMRMTPHAFVEQVRMFHAIDALRRTAAGVQEIAIDCGFYDASSFVKRFKRFTGHTPLNYRRQRRHPKRTAMAIPRLTS